MIVWRRASLTLAMALIASGAIAQPSFSSDTVCAATKNNGRGLIGESNSGNHANEDGTIATSLWPQGTVTFKPDGPGCVNDDGSLSMKWPWWHEGKNSRLTIEGRRLDGAAPPLRARVPTGYFGRFQPSALIFPTPGCWQVSGIVDKKGLTFMVRVVKSGEGPGRCQGAPTTGTPSLATSQP